MTASRLTTAAVFALGALMVVVGLIFVINGMQIVRMELGPAEIIGGAVSASAGCIVLALGVLLGQVEGLRAAVGRGAARERPRPPPVETPLRPAVVSFGADPVSAPPPHPLAPAGWREPQAAVVRPEPALTAALHPEPPVELPMDAPAEPAEPVLAESAPALAHAEEEQAAQGPSVVAPDRVADPLAEGPPARQKPGFLSSLLSRRASAPVQRRVGSGQRSPGSEPRPTPLNPAAAWDADLPDEGQPLDAVGRDEPVAHVEPLAPEPHLPLEDAPIGAPEPVLSPVEPPAFDQDEPPAHAPEPEPEPDPLKPVVVGRYNAGAASYVMYSNGMIEVETDQGTHQFASMQELKAFIEKREARVS